MERIRKVGTTLRNNWKKTVFLSAASVYGGKWYLKKQEDNQFMAQCCREALSYGSLGQNCNQKNYHVTVVLNPAASGGKARKLFEQYSAPLLHLAGFKVSIQKTEAQKEGEELIRIMDNCDAVLVAGGDGTVMEAVTGFMMRELQHQNLVMGVLPVGINNTLASNLFPIEDQVHQIAEATMSVIRQLKRPISVIEVENLSEEFRGKKLHGVNKIEVGAFREAEARKDSYWLFGGLKSRMTYIFSYLIASAQITWDWPLAIKSVTSHTISRQIEAPRAAGLAGIFSLSSSTPSVVTEDHVVTTWQESADHVLASQCEISLSKDFPDKLEMTTISNNLDFTQFVSQGFARLNKDQKSDVVPTSTRTSEKFELDTSATPEAPRLMSLDGEEVDLTAPIRIALIKDKITMFCSSSQAVSLSNNTVENTGSLWSGRSVASNLIPQNNSNKRFL